MLQYDEISVIPLPFQFAVYVFHSLLSLSLSFTRTHIVCILGQMEWCPFKWEWTKKKKFNIIYSFKANRTWNYLILWMWFGIWNSFYAWMYITIDIHKMGIFTLMFYRLKCVSELKIAFILFFSLNEDKCTVQCTSDRKK